MRLITGIVLSTSSIVVTTVMLMAIAWWAAQETDHRLAAEARLTELRHLSSELMLIAHEYRHWPGERPRQQWSATYHKVMHLLQEAPGLESSPVALTAGVTALDEIFQHFIAQSEQVAQPGGLAQQEYPDAQFQHLLIEHRQLIAQLERQQFVQRQRLNEALNTARTVFGLAVVILLLVALFVALSLRRRLRQPLQLLITQAERYANGDLSARSQLRQSDELGDLSRSFDQLGEALARSMTSRDLLEVEVALRETSEAEQAALLAELKRSNVELQQFAYVASHDLQEPLRTITSYVQLIERRYADQLDEDGREFIAFAVDGANRMRTLIDDLLTLSRVSTHGKPFESVAIASVVEQTRSDLHQALEDTGAKLSIGELPVIWADPTQMRQLFDNLLVNALRYRRMDEPVMVQIQARPSPASEPGWIFSVCDNGMGIEPRFFERIFVLFQRLHGRGEYPGTGIGLAICKRIVERHGGRIWVESTPKVGSCFEFFLPQASRASAY
ncbi:sensor histidine kinase [Rhabdochromatium marinum]|uniref:sensor histidine kinase n=1 Tax=Rhabdochromatium marinum TaxID=48729 RepID=UPI00190896AD|nr:ATP-binding protein [Rhabdochromatium marinum]MBK1650543.1 hypothetical protein [Rhabdochromatium marinum]